MENRSWQAAVLPVPPSINNEFPIQRFAKFTKFAPCMQCHCYRAMGSVCRRCNCARCGYYDKMFWERRHGWSHRRIVQVVSIMDQVYKSVMRIRRLTTESQRSPRVLHRPAHIVTPIVEPCTHRALLTETIRFLAEMRERMDSEDERREKLADFTLYLASNLH